MKTIKLKRPFTIPHGEGKKRWAELTLRDADAGDIIDAGYEGPEGMSKMELEMRVAAKCSDVPYVILRKMRPVDVGQIGAWYDAQHKADYKSDEDEEDGVEYPLTVGGTPSAS